ncbi:hypothetical protein Q7P37_000393 [Cladosporium fusiforme]
MSSRCFCGAVFITVDAINKHIVSQGHLLQCTCGCLLGDFQKLENHQHDVEHPTKTSFTKQKHKVSAGRTKCVLCNKQFRQIDGLRQHALDKHAFCPLCEQVFDTKATCHRHQMASNHCYCAEHGKAFSADADLKQHKRGGAHTGGFECTDCQRSFRSCRALDDHLNSEGHSRVVNALADEKRKVDTDAKRLVRQEEIDLRCDACNKNFRTLRAFKQHKESLKHKPLSELKCPLSTLCTGTFNSPSAL